MTKIVLELEEAPDGTDDTVPSMLPDPVPSDLDPTLVESNFTYASDVPGPGGVVVRAEEALIVVLVLVLWVAAIALFFNRWGKIRMLEPYQPKFQQQHRQSCAIGDPNPLPHRACSKFNIHCADHVVHQTSCTSVFNRPRQNSVFVGSSVSLLPPQNTPRRAKSAFDLQSLVLAECTAQTHLDDDSAKPLKPNPAADASVKPVGHFQRERGMSICHFDRTDVLARPLQRERGMSICNFDRTDVLVRPLQRERGMSICHFDRTDVLARPLARERGVSICHFDRTDVLARPQPPPPPPLLHRECRLGVCNFERFDHASKLTPRERRMSVCNFDRVESLPKVSAHTKERGAASVCHFDRQTPSCSKTADALYNYKATCV